MAQRKRSAAATPANDQNEPEPSQQFPQPQRPTRRRGPRAAADWPSAQSTAQSSSPPLATKGAALPVIGMATTSSPISADAAAWRPAISMTANTTHASGAWAACVSVSVSASPRTRRGIGIHPAKCTRRSEACFQRLVSREQRLPPARGAPSGRRSTSSRIAAGGLLSTPPSRLHHATKSRDHAP